VSSRWLVAAAVALGWAILPPSGARADNPIVQTNYTSDPAPMVYNGRLYLITTHDENVAGQPCTAKAGYTLCKWFAYSSADMVNWTDHGTVASWSAFTWAGTAAWAPQAISRNGKFYLYVPLTDASGSTVIGVGVSDSPLGPYKDAVGRALVTSGCSGGTGDIDPTVFIDDDGQAYLYFGRSVPGYVKLNADMISYTGGVQCPTVNTQTFGPAPSAGGFPSQYEEGPWIMKRGATYYLAYAANGIPEDISYSKATAPTGPFTYVGTIMKAAGASFTNHTGIIDFNGHSYFFYHDGSLQKGGSVPSNGDGYHRSVCLEEFTYKADGSFPSIVPTTAGPQAIASLNPFMQTEAETIAWESGVQTEATNDTGGGMDVTAIDSGDYIKVRSIDFGVGATSFDARVAATSGGSIELHLDSLSGTLIGTCAISGTGGAQTWATRSCSVTSTTGVHDLFLKFTGSGSNLFKFNWWRFGGPGAGSADAGNTGAAGAGGTTGSGGAGGSAGAGAAGAAGGAAGGAGTRATGGAGTGGRGGNGGGSGGTPVGGRGGSVGAGGAGGTGGAAATGGNVAGGGTTGTGGVTASGGTVGSGGTQASGGISGSGGSGSLGRGGASGGGVSGEGNPGGCSCEVASRRSDRRWGILMLLFGSLSVRRRRNRESRRALQARKLLDSLGCGSGSRERRATKT
jgi:hypothetical protein